MQPRRLPPPDASVHSPLLLDVTIRDGGYVNGHTWTPTEAAAIVDTIDAAGIPYTEVGYLRSHSDDRLQQSAHCPPDYLEKLAAQTEQTRLVVMVRPGEAPLERLSEVADHGVSMIRVLAARHDLARATAYVDAGHAAGLTVAVNLTHISRIDPASLAAAVRQYATAGADIVYLADSNGSLYPEDVRLRVSAAAEHTPVPIGFHPHDNLGLAFSNACAAIEAGATAIDASLAGIGKGGGNLRMELIAAHCAVRHGADLRLDPLMTDQNTHAARLRMLADGGSRPLVAGMLDISLDQFRQFQEQAAVRGYDSLLRDGFEPGPAAVPAGSVNGTQPNAVSTA